MFSLIYISRLLYLNQTKPSLTWSKNQWSDSQMQFVVSHWIPLKVIERLVQSSADFISKHLSNTFSSGWQHLSMWLQIFCWFGEWLLLLVLPEWLCFCLSRTLWSWCIQTVLGGVSGGARLNQLQQPIRKIPSGGQFQHSVAGLSGSVLGVWRLLGSLVVGNGTGWWGLGSAPSQLCGGEAGSQRRHFLRRSWTGPPFLWVSARTWASVEDCRLEESPHCCHWRLGLLWWWLGPSIWLCHPSRGCEKHSLKAPVSPCGWRWMRRKMTMRKTRS